MRVNRASLGPLKELAEGGFGKVFHAEQYRLPGDASAIAYKEFTKKVAEQARAAQDAVSFRDLLSLADRADLDRCTVWPRAARRGAGCRRRPADAAHRSGLLLPDDRSGDRPDDQQAPGAAVADRDPGATCGERTAGRR